MLEKHTTKEGQVMFISQMEDTHLNNTIHLLLRALKQAKQALAIDVSINKTKSALYCVNPDYIQKKAQRTIRKVTKKLYAYLSEGMLRGLNYTQELQEIFERKGKEDTFELLENREVKMITDSQDDEEGGWF